MARVDPSFPDTEEQERPQSMPRSATGLVDILTGLFLSTVTRGLSATAELFVIHCHDNLICIETSRKRAPYRGCYRLELGRLMIIP